MPARALIVLTGEGFFVRSGKIVTGSTDNTSSAVKFERAREPGLTGSGGYWKEEAETRPAAMRSGPLLVYAASS